MSGLPLVALDGVAKTFESGLAALDRLTFDLAEGEFLTLLGPSGCGKSTALRLVAGLTEPTGGAVRWREGFGGGRPAEEIGFVFQEPTLMPWATVFENVYLPLRLTGISHAEARPRIEEALLQVGLSRFAQSYPRELSGGMKMRASIARAIVTRPRLLLMDEPFAALDEMTRFKLNNDVLRLWQEQGLTIIFVTHSVYESVYMSNRVVVMAARPGRVVADLPIEGSYPRAEDFRATEAYAESCQAASKALRGTLDHVDIDH